MYKIYGITDKGLVYEHNEDCFMVNSDVCFDKLNIEVDSQCILAAVADGVGGENAGELASRMCLEKLAVMDMNLDLEEIREYIKGISQDISDFALNKPELSGMATTLAGVICSGDRFIILNVGNSRVYRFRNGNLRQFTIDDTLVQIMYDSGQITREEMGNHPNRHVLLQAIGKGNINTPIDVHLHEAKNPMEKGDILLLCTDGLSDLVNNDEIKNSLESSIEIEEMAEELVKKAKIAGGYDNITVLMIKRH
ncbi:MAG: protein phosphatase 2C domain-containing protein [Tissierellales bacterium]